MVMLSILCRNLYCQVLRSNGRGGNLVSYINCKSLPCGFLCIDSYSCSSSPFDPLVISSPGESQNWFSAYLILPFSTFFFFFFSWWFVSHPSSQSHFTAPHSFIFSFFPYRSLHCSAHVCHYLICQRSHSASLTSTYHVADAARPSPKRPLIKIKITFHRMAHGLTVIYAVCFLPPHWEWDWVLGG